MPDSNYMIAALEIMAFAFIFVIGLIALVIVVVFTLDITQRKHAIRRNYPVVAHFRYAFETLGKFFRQYFFAMDREE
ncbi:MAG: FMN-binding glutamate synthase family protein, partial [Gammaproteobacteria bacterium]|nr:FMN-binding glutamate synthase family protein [Gammaproteobacteria bacterium]